MPWEWKWHSDCTTLTSEIKKLKQSQCRAPRGDGGLSLIKRTSRFRRATICALRVHSYTICLCKNIITALASEAVSEGNISNQQTRALDDFEKTLVPAERRSSHMKSSVGAEIIQRKANAARALLPRRLGKGTEAVHWVLYICLQTY